MPISSRSANIFAVTSEGILYGFSVFMFVLSMWFTLRDRNKRQINYYMVAAGSALLVLSTAEMAVNIARLYEGFISKGPMIPEGPEGYFGDVSQLTFVIKSCLYNAQTLILDAVVIYRVYVVWQTVLIVIFPIFCWFALVADCIGLNWALATASAHKADIFAAQTGRWITSYYSLTLGTNLLATILLASRIWTVTRRSTKYCSDNMVSPVVRVIVESGAIYSMTITAALILFVNKMNGVYVLLDMISPIISIVFHMLIIRIRAAAELSAISASTLDPSIQWSGPTISQRGRNMLRRAPSGAYEMTELKIEITKVVEDDSGDGHERGATNAPSSLPPANIKRDSLGFEV